MVGWYRQIVEIDRIQAASREVQTAADQVGLPADSPFDGEPHDDPRFVSLQQLCAGSQAVNALRTSPGLLSLLQGVLGGEVVGGQGDVVRVVGPNDAPTPMHQDAAYVANPETVTAWIPLTTCPLDLGPVGIVAASAGGAVLEHGPGGLLDTEGLLLEAEPMEVGDVLLFTATTVHGALPNRSHRVRFSIDLRFVRA